MKKIIGIFSKRSLLVIAAIFSVVARIIFPSFLKACKKEAKVEETDLGSVAAFAHKWLADDNCFVIPSKVTFGSKEKFNAALFNFGSGPEEVLMYRHFSVALMQSKPWESYYQNALQSAFFPNLKTMPSEKKTGWWASSASIFGNKPAQKILATAKWESTKICSQLAPEDYAKKLPKKVHLLDMLGQPTDNVQLVSKPVNEAVHLTPAYVGGTIPSLLFELIYVTTLPTLENVFFYGSKVAAVARYAGVNDVLGIYVDVLATGKDKDSSGKITFLEPFAPDKDFVAHNVAQRLYSDQTFAGNTVLNIEESEKTNVELLFRDFFRGAGNERFLQSFVCAMAIRMQPPPVMGVPAGRWDFDLTDGSMYGVTWKRDLVLSPEKNLGSPFSLKFGRAGKALPKGSDFRVVTKAVDGGEPVLKKNKKKEAIVHELAGSLEELAVVASSVKKKKASSVKKPKKAPAVEKPKKVSSPVKPEKVLSSEKPNDAKATKVAKTEGGPKTPHLPEVTKGATKEKVKAPSGGSSGKRPRPPPPAQNLSQDDKGNSTPTKTKKKAAQGQNGSSKTKGSGSKTKKKKSAVESAVE